MTSAERVGCAQIKLSLPIECRFVLRSNVCGGPESRTAASLLVHLVRQSAAETGFANRRPENFGRSDHRSAFLRRDLLLRHGIDAEQEAVRMLAGV